MYFLCIGLPNILMCELIRCAKLAHDAWVQYQRIECLGAGTGCCATQYECVARRSMPPFTRWETNAANTLYPPLLAGNQIQPPLQPPTGDLLAKHLLLLYPHLLTTFVHLADLRYVSVLLSTVMFFDFTPYN